MKMIVCIDELYGVVSLHQAQLYYSIYWVIYFKFDAHCSSQWQVH